MIDSEGFEIPEEYSLASEKDCLMSLSLYEHNRWLNKMSASAERYRLECIKRHLTDKTMTQPMVLHTIYHSSTNTIELQPGYIFDSKTCTIWSSK